MPFLHSSSAGFTAACEIISRLNERGFQGRIVGGAVRDMLLGRQPDDFDLVTSAPPDELQKIFPDAKFVGACFGVALIRRGEAEVEVASCRSERSYLDGRHPESVSYTADFALDARRRDFTVNAMSYDPLSGELFDYFGGAEDLHCGILRTAGDAEERFSEDYLRILRAVRFAAKLGFELDENMFPAMKKLACRTAELSGERIRGELSSMLTGGDPERAFRLLAGSGVLKYILPEVDALRGLEQPPQYHPEGDVFEHTMLMLRHMVVPETNLAWSVLLHDIGKAVTFSRDADGRIRFFTHEERGAVMTEDICKRFHFSNSDSGCCVQAVRNHMRFASVEKMRSGKLRQLVADKNFALELELHRLDCIACHGMMNCFLFLLDYLREHKGSESLPPPLLRGRDLLAAGFKPGPQFKRVIDAVYERQLAGEITSPEAALTEAAVLLGTTHSSGHSQS